METAAYLLIPPGFLFDWPLVNMAHVGRTAGRVTDSSPASISLFVFDSDWI